MIWSLDKLLLTPHERVLYFLRRIYNDDQTGRLTVTDSIIAPNTKTAKFHVLDDVA